MCWNTLTLMALYIALINAFTPHNISLEQVLLVDSFTDEQTEGQTS